MELNRFQISEIAIEPDKLRLELQSEIVGAYTSFEGWVRNHNEGASVQALEYSAYKVLAVKEGDRIIAEALDRFEIAGAAAIHRIGLLDIGDVAVWVGASSAHRGPAFDGCRYIIDEIKDRVPIWKRESYEHGPDQWVNCAKGSLA